MGMLSGPEILLKNLLGIDPNEMRNTVQNMVNQVNEMHSFMKEIRGRLDRLEQHLGVDNDAKPILDYNGSAALGT